MKYKEYMDLFTVSSEVKSSVYNKIKRHERADTKKYNDETDVSTATPKGFKLHPKRWIAIATSLVLLVAAVPIVYFTVPREAPPEAGNPGSPVDPVDPGPGVTPYNVSLGFMTNLMVDVEGVTAYSIRRDDSSGEEATVKPQRSISLLSAKLLADNGKDNDNNSRKTKHNNYLYSTSEDYKYGNVEYDGNNIQKVTFVKNSETSEDVYDDKGNLIDSNRKITQEELDGQINKIFTTKQFTYIQFVAMVESSGSYPYKDAEGNISYEQVNLRPASMTYDAEGVAEFDKTNYYSSNLTASFVIDNFTGYIYKIENFHIKSFYNGLVIGNDGYYYSVGTDAEHNLVFTDVLPNKDATVNNVILDNYGWTFVANDVVDSVDSERKVIYTTENKYVIDSDRNVYTWSYYDSTTIEYLSQKMIDGKAVTFENTGIIRDIKCLRTNYEITPIGMYEDLNVYPFTLNTKMNNLAVNLAAYNHETNCGLGVEYYSIRYHWLDNNYDTILAIDNGLLYYRSVNLNDYRNTQTTLYISNDFTKLSDLTLYEAVDYYMSVGNDRYKINEVYYHADANETKYYHIVRTTTGVELVELTSKSYADNVFIFQPINK